MQNKCYALFDITGKIRKISMTSEDVTNYFIAEFPTKMWNDLYNAIDEDRKSVFESYGWSVKAGQFINT